MRDGMIKYVPGTFLIELLSVVMTLDTFAVDMNQSIFFPPGVFGKAYGEDRTPLYVLLPDTNNDKAFLMQQLPLLYNALADRNAAAKMGYELVPWGPFMSLMNKFVTTREVTLPLVFACICWMKSVAALQGHRELGRNISLAFNHSRGLQRNIEAALESKTALLAYDKGYDLLKRCVGEIKHLAPLCHLARANPLFAGLTMMNHHFQYMHIANEVMFATSRFRAFGHLYNALVQEGYLDPIPFFDKVYDVYAQEVFTPSRAAAVHGSYYRTYLLSSNLRVNFIEAVFRVCEQTYFTFSPHPDFVSQEYGAQEDNSRGENYEEVFEDLMKLLRESDGPLTGSELNYIKFELKKDLNLLGLISSDPDPGVDRMYGDLCSLLHQAAAGPAHDPELVDWMIQMGALIIQPTLHCRQEPLLKDMKVPRWLYPNTMAVHNSAIAGYEDIVRVILGADSMIDLNAPTFHTKETLAHLALKNGHKNLFNILQAFGADLRIKDSKGQSLSDVASNRKWVREIAVRTAEYFAKVPGDARRSDSILPPQIAPRTERLYKTVLAQYSSTAQKGHSNKKKRMKKCKQGPPKEESLITAAAIQGDSIVNTRRVLMRLLQSAGFEIDESMESESVTLLEEMLRKLSSAIFARLRDPTITADNKADNVHNACELIKEMENFVASYSDPSRLNSVRYQIRVVICSEAVHGIHMMQRLNRVGHTAIAVPEFGPILDYAIRLHRTRSL